MGDRIGELMDRTTVVHLRPRWDDCDAYGHVNNAMYLALVRSATDDGLAALGVPGLGANARLAEVELAYREPLRAGDDVDVRLEVRSSDDATLTLTYEFEVAHRACANATARWARRGRSPDVALGTAGRGAGGVAFVMPHLVRTYEIGANGEARPTVILQWLEQAIFVAAERVGWTRERMREADFITLQVGHHLVLGAPALDGDELSIHSRLAEVRRVSGVWRHDVRRSDGEVVALDDSRGAFLDHAGRIRPAPEGMLGALLAGPVVAGAVR